MLSIIALTIQVAVVATLLNVPLSMLVSWLLVKRRIKGRFVLDLLVSLPLALPPVALGYFLLIVLGRSGPVGGPLFSILGWDIAFTWVAASVASAVMSFPLMTRTIMVAMGSVDNRVEMSARSLGAGPVRVVFTITIPLAYRGILAGVLIGFVRAMSEFGATIIVAGNIPGRTQTLALALFTDIQVGDNSSAIRLVGVAIFLAVLTLLAHNWLLERSNRSEN